LVKIENKFRKLTPRECFRFQGFPEDYVLPNISNSQLYKQSGNSVSVPVIQKLAKNILKTMNGESCAEEYELELF
jgi:DNA (cytosine-5)-methyltransferase 1